MYLHWWQAGRKSDERLAVELYQGDAKTGYSMSLWILVDYYGFKSTSLELCLLLIHIYMPSANQYKHM